MAVTDPVNLGPPLGGPVGTLQGFIRFWLDAIVNRRWMRKGIRTVTTTYTVDLEDCTVLGDATGGAFTATLPKAAAAKGRIYTVKRISAANNVTIDGDGAETIDGAATVVLSAQYQFRMMQSDGSNWHVISS